MPISYHHNPFATRFTQPGTIPFIFREDESLGEIQRHFRKNQFVGQIVGPHGSGKTTLTHDLVTGLEDQFSRIRRLTIRSSSQLKIEDSHCPSLSSNRQLLIIDGLERFSRLHRWLLLENVRRRRIGLLITTHRQMFGIPVLFKTRPSLDTLNQLIRQLAPGLAIEQGIVKSSLANSGGSIRESLMTLYNWVESNHSLVAIAD